MKPKLIHPVICKIKNIDKSQTVFDEDFGEPIQSGIIRGSVITVKAQIKINKMNETDPRVSGFDLVGEGYLLVDNDTANLIDINAEIISIDGRTTEYFVKEKRPMAHYEHGNFIMVVFVNKITGDKQ